MALKENKLAEKYQQMQKISDLISDGASTFL